MNVRKSLVIIMLGILLNAHASPLNRLGPAGSNILDCLRRTCDMNSGPVCAIDETGFPKTFENQCWADLAYCREGTFYAVIKPGEC